jgi:c-di-GMP-related signal transduction protein
MLSLADVMMQTPLEEILNEIGLSDEMKAAISHHDGVLGKLLLLAKLIEASDFEGAKTVVEELDLTSTDLLAIQLESLEWSTEIVKQAA